MTTSVVATQIADRAADPTILAEAIAAAARQSRYADVLPWRPAGLAQGHAGIALLCAELDRREPGHGWDRAGHHHLSVAVAAAGPNDVSLFSGLAGVGFAAIQLAAGRRRYLRLLEGVDAVLAPRVQAEAERLATARGCAAAEADLVSGLTGVGVYLLTRYQYRRSVGGVDDQTMILALSGLARLLVSTDDPRAWHTPAALATGSLREAFPRGHYNCGMAHGVSGPLALLSLGLLAGLRVPLGRQAIEVAASWLVEHRTGASQQPDWPDAVALDPADRPTDASAPGRAAWCYGALGVARSLWLAGAAVGEAEWQSLAARTVRAVATRPRPSWSLFTPTFCHGSAGQLQVLRRFAVDLADPCLTATADTLAAELVAGFDPASVLGVRGVEPEGVLVDHPGLLDGAPGIALALLGVCPDGDQRPDWDRMFLLS
ncbi:lanthionine synthetase C family protein [Kribbella sp. NBC_01510]|uniref:lanthionine synthetase C family protein n=1 Tax=Kribbella sp. NBC_01510 TaxID=2903581 RepID=UPI00386C8EED